MKEKKNIDRLFQEQLKDFEAMPNDQVWLNIEAELHKDEKKRRVIPIWFKYAGIAAAFILGTFILSESLFLDSKTTNDIVLYTTSSKKWINKKHIPMQESLKTSLNKDAIANNTKEDLIKEKETIIRTHSKLITNYEKETTPFNSSKNATYKEKNPNNSDAFLSKNNSPINQSVFNKKTDEYLSLNVSKNNSKPSNSNETFPNKEKDKKGIQEKEATTKQLVIAPEKPNELDEILNKKEEQKLENASTVKNRWQIIPNIAPLFVNTNTGGSAIDDQFSKNSKTAENSISYGIGINYAVSKKLAIRTGINKMNLDYNTNNISFSAGLASNTIANINYAPNNEIKIATADANNLLTPSEKGLQKTDPGALNQKMGYYEFPIELSYTLINKKIGVNLIGGISTLFLNENKISLVSTQTNVVLGEAKNLNKVHLSTNVGIGFNYQFIKSFQLNFEPIIKYQFNTFTKDDNNFKPLFLGLYTGVSYSF